MGLVEGVEVGAVLIELFRGAESPKLRQHARVDGVDAGRDLTALRGQAGTDAGVGVVAKNLAWNRLAVDAVHHEAPAEVVLGPQQHPDARHRHAGRSRRFQELVLRRAVRFAPVLTRVATQYESAAVFGADQIERPRFPRRPTRQTPELVHRTGPARRSDRTCQRLRDLGFEPRADAIEHDPAEPTTALAQSRSAAWPHHPRKCAARRPLRRPPGPDLHTFSTGA